MNLMYFSLIISFFTLSCSTTPDTSTTGVQESVVEATLITEQTPVDDLEIEPKETNQISTTENQVKAFEKKTPSETEPKETPKEVAIINTEELPKKMPEEKITASVEETTKAQEQALISEEKIDEIITIAKPDHTPFDQMLQAHVSSSGVVNYQNWKNDLSKLDEYLADLAANEPSSSWTRSEKMAYWINLYNAGTVKLILDNLPLKSIMDIDGGKPWNRKWIKAGSNTYSLNQIENDIIRPRFGDGRIHFAVNCAAKSCPPLYNRAFTASNLDSSLARLSRKFINNTAFNKISENQLQLSNIFNWYASDFGDLNAFIRQYTDVEISDSAKVSFIDYDWALNGR